MIRGEEVARRREYSHLVAGPERTTRESSSNAGSYGARNGRWEMGVRAGGPPEEGPRDATFER